MASIHKADDGSYRVVLYKGGKWVADLFVRAENDQLQFHEFPVPEAMPVVYFKYSELLLLGHRGIFRRLDSGKIEWRNNELK